MDEKQKGHQSALCSAVRNGRVELRANAQNSLIV